jgi:hypothetical protein
LPAIESKGAGFLLALIMLATFIPVIPSMGASALPMTADFVVEPTVGNFSTVFKFNASSTSNPGGSLSDLAFRWDWESDGVFDTSWSSNYSAEHKYSSNGTFQPRLQIKNLTGQTANATSSLAVDGSAPAVTLLQSDGRMFKNGSVVDPGHGKIICVAVEDLSSVSRVEYSLDDAPFENVTVAMVSDRMTISLPIMAKGDHYIVVQVTNSVGLSAKLGFFFVASAEAAAQFQLGTVWIIVAALVAAIGAAISFLLIRRRWKNNPPERL